MVPQLALPEGGEWIVILVIVVLLFGAKKLPELTRNAARAMKEFDKARHGDDEPPTQLPATQAPASATPTPATDSATPTPATGSATPTPATGSATPTPATSSATSTPATGAAVSNPAPQAPVDGSGGRVDLESGRSEGGGQ
ncbi:twin-arginine translocase TatA/TatE family subunit [Kribbella sp. NPDC055110]